MACALLIGRAFLDNGWSMQPGDQLDIDDLPAHTFRVEGASRMQPCAEVYLTDHAAQTILAQGVMPVMSYRDRNAVRIMRFQSVADPLRPLQGPWA